MGARLHNEFEPSRSPIFAVLFNLTGSLHPNFNNLLPQLPEVRCPFEQIRVTPILFWVRFRAGLSSIGLRDPHVKTQLWQLSIKFARRPIFARAPTWPPQPLPQPPQQQLQP